MQEVVLYWHHICILQKKEQEQIARAATLLREEGIMLTVRYFGLGHGMALSEYLAKPDAQLPDLMVTADLEVFEHEGIWKKFAGELHAVEGLLPQRETELIQQVSRSKTLLPILAIPLVYATTRPEACRGKALTEIAGLSVGGVNNSAVKTVVKTLWSREGAAAAERFLAGCEVTDMPILAFTKARKGEAAVALVPSVYVQSADGESLFLKTPKEGAVLIPTYLCARQRIERSTAQRVAEAIFTADFCDFYAENGDLLVLVGEGAKQSTQRL